MLETAIIFGKSLDADDFELAKSMLAEDCQYIIGEDILIGPDAICNSYEGNMIAGRKKMDELEWGSSKIEVISENEYYVHFTDYLTHKSKKYTHRCKQKLTTNSQGKIYQIEHIHDQDEQDRLNEFYKSVGIPLVT